MIIEGMLLGLAYVLPPGPVTTETVRRSLCGGTPAALAVQAGAVGGRLLYALLVGSGIGHLLAYSSLKASIGLLGALLLLTLGLSALYTGWMPSRREVVSASRSPDAAVSLWQQARVGLAVSLFNPFALGFWMTVSGTATPATPAWLAGFLIGSSLASLLTALAAGQLRRPGVLTYGRWISAGCGCVLIGFGVRLGWTMLGQF